VTTTTLRVNSGLLCDRQMALPPKRMSRTYCRRQVMRRLDLRLRLSRFGRHSELRELVLLPSRQSKPYTEEICSDQPHLYFPHPYKSSGLDAKPSNKCRRLIALFTCSPQNVAWKQVRAYGGRPQLTRSGLLVEDVPTTTWE
jgi:hypothetical protein